MSDPVVVAGGREVVGRLDTPDADSVVVACPPHPRHGGARSDPRLRAVSDALAPDVACLRFDYGEWDDQRGPALCTGDAERALAWARGRFDTVGLFGYSFGAGVALRAAAAADPPDACSALAPPGEAVDTLAAVDCPLQVVVGERDTTVDWEPVADRAAALGQAVVRLPSGHGFAGQFHRLGRAVGAFLSDRL
ncbi:alpha/beta hydrolase [Haloarcula onubensis]|uniref:Alpha/beta hydrolase n=1 Tax=Haloarcula onubensis TaxID=2950539 RepID=A0ABU2FRL4_9EURY|nr:alpha/beta hydrolase [Halomicroarcula sp. S3CR25-11]MDS0283409.1 alpha/beta hydrolase [Halomicroarcula sp. S3CR25-11]